MRKSEMFVIPAKAGIQFVQKNPGCPTKAFGHDNLIFILLTIVILFFISSIAFAGDVGSIENTYKSLSDFSANFTQETKVALVDRVITQTGTFRFKKGGKLKIEYAGKSGKHYVSDGTTLWIFNPGDEASLQTFAISDKTVPKEALSFLNGFGQLKKEFNVSKSSLFPEKSGLTALHLVPKTKAKHYDSLDTLFGEDNLLRELIIKNISGNVSHYYFSDIKTNSGLSDDVFTLKNN